MTLELGGKSPQIVFADADLDTAANAAAWAVWGHSGQICTAGSRVLVNRTIHDEFVARMVDASRALKIGSCFDDATCIGPVISRQQLDQVTRYVELGKAEGANLALGGARHGDKGFFFEPTIFTAVSNRMRIAQEEIFGPVMAVIPFDTDEEAYAIANDTTFGLAAGVWTRDLGRAHRASQRLKVGTVWINTYQLNETSVPYGGVKQSGFGRSLGAVSIEEFTQVKSVWINAA
jgi:acyl-CoA reductase-like NAD-dependent aldehyde dehydrogenase